MTLIHQPFDKRFKQSPFPPTNQDIYQDFEAPELARQWVFKPFQLIDLTVLSVDTLQQHGTVALMELLLKQVWVKDFLATFQDLIQRGILSHVINKTTEAYLLSVLNYGVDQGGEGQSADELIQLLAHALPERREVIMTFRQQLEKQGVQKGLEAGILQGMERGKLETAREMLQVGSSVDFIKKVTGLSDLNLNALMAQDE